MSSVLDHAIPVMINGRQYSWSDIKVVIGSQVITGINEITYSTTQEKTNVTGAGNKTIGRSYGAITHSASITLSEDTIENFRASAPEHSLLAIGPFMITVSFIAPGNIPMTHRLRFCEFKSDETNYKQGDGAKFAKCDLIVGDIVRGVI